MMTCSQRLWIVQEIPQQQNQAHCLCSPEGSRRQLVLPTHPHSQTNHVAPKGRSPAQGRRPDTLGAGTSART